MSEQSVIMLKKSESNNQTTITKDFTNLKQAKQGEAMSRKIIIDSLAQELKASGKDHFNGIINVQTGGGENYRFYYRLGRLVWATGGLHTYRRWRRNLLESCPQVNPNSIRLREEEKLPSVWDYHILTLLCKRQQIKAEQAFRIITNTVKEILFDLIQQAGEEPLTYQREEKPTFESPITFLSIEQVIELTKKDWQAWCDRNFTILSPNLSPKIKQPEQLRQQVSENVYKNFVNLLDGSRTLRDLAVQMKQDLLQITRLLVPYIHKDLIELVEIPDLPYSMMPKTNSKVLSEDEKLKNILTATPQKLSTRPLIACIDDSLQTCQMMDDILTKAGYRLLSILDGIQALPTLIECKPDLIFLDLIMPIANGYEICAQIRRVSQLQNIPIIILTGNHGVIDRVRSKVVGASEFVSKPVETQKIISVVQKFLSVTSEKKINKTAIEPRLIMNYQ